MRNQDKPAFPIDEETTDRIDQNITIYTGLTKLEYFSGLAMQGIMTGRYYSEMINMTPESIADLAVDYAKQLLKEIEYENLHSSKDEDKVPEDK